MHIAGGGGGAGYTGGAGGIGTMNYQNNPLPAGAGTSFLAASVSGTCTGLPMNAGEGYVSVALT